MEVRRQPVSDLVLLHRRQKELKRKDKNARPLRIQVHGQKTRDKYPHERLQSPPVELLTSKPRIEHHTYDDDTNPNQTDQITSMKVHPHDHQRHEPPDSARLSFAHKAI